MTYERNFANAADFLRALSWSGEAEFIYENIHYIVTQHTQNKFFRR